MKTIENILEKPERNWKNVYGDNLLWYNYHMRINGWVLSTWHILEKKIMSKEKIIWKKKSFNYIELYLVDDCLVFLVFQGYIK